MPGDWLKGGLRYKRVKRKVTERFGEAGLGAFFIATVKPLPSLPRMHSVSGGIRALAADEYVIAVTGAAVYLVEMGGMGMFSARLKETSVEIPLDDVFAEYTDRTVTINGRPFHVFPYHDEDARALVEIVQERHARTRQHE